MSTKIVVDTNVMLSAALAIRAGLLDSPTFVLFSKIVTREIIAVASPQMLYELARKLEDPKFEFPASFILEFTRLVTNAVDLVAIRGLNMGCRDKADDMFIETAYNGRVDALVTRDRDLQDAKVRYGLAKRGCEVIGVMEALAGLQESVIVEKNENEQLGT